jgi:NitT/TauT family transport system substrate-binding protein
MDRRTFIGALAAAGAVPLLAGCDPETGNNTSSDGKRKAVRVAQWGQERYLIYLPFYIAQAEDLFSKAGLDVTLSFSGNDDQVFAAVLRGDAQFGIGDPIFAAISRNRGADGAVVGQIVGRIALWGVAKKGSKLLGAASDFANLKIGTFPRPSTTYTLMRDMIDKNRVSGARIVEVPIGSEAALLESGGADVVMMLEPAASIATSQGYDIVTSFPKLWGPFAFTGLTSTSSFVQGNRDVVAAMRSAMQSALDLAHRNPARATSVARALFPSLDAATVEAAVRRMLSEQTLPNRFAVDPASWAAAVRVRQAMGELGAGSYQDVIA